MNGTDFASMSGMIKIYTATDILAWQEPEWLIGDYIHVGELGLLYGPPGSGKSFLALDWALHIATGQPWLGRFPVKRGPVFYFVGEGVASLKKRLVAWSEARRCSLHELGAYFQCRAVSLRQDETITAIQEALIFFEDPQGKMGPGDICPSLIVVDTLSQFFGGGDENGADMTHFVDNLRVLSRDVDCAVLIIHHTNKSGLSERGHTSLRGNIDVAYRCHGVREGRRLTGMLLENDKQRDAAEAEALPLRLIPSVRSLVVAPALTGSTSVESVFRVIQDHPNLRLGELFALTEVSPATVKRVIEVLLRSGRITKENHRFVEKMAHAE